MVGIGSTIFNGMSCKHKMGIGSTIFNGVSSKHMMEIAAPYSRGYHLGT